MAVSWPPPLPDGVYSLRFRRTGSSDAAYSASHRWNFVHPADEALAADKQRQAFSCGMRITATGATLTYSFDGVTDHGTVSAGTTVQFDERHEGGIAVKGAGASYVIEAW